MRSKSLALGLILLTFFGTSNSWHADDADTGQAVVVLHDHNAHHEALRGPSSADGAPTHCALCHWLQSFRASSVKQARVPFEGTAQIAEYATVHSPTLGTDRSQSPSRAPPA